jgi:hypothetical protein
MTITNDAEREAAVERMGDLAAAIHDIEVTFSNGARTATAERAELAVITKAVVAYDDANDE